MYFSPRNPKSLDLKGGTTITNAILMLSSQTWRKFATYPYGTSISLQCIDATISEAEKNKDPYYKRFTEIIAAVTITCFACAFNQQFWEKKLNSAYINCSPSKAVLACCIELAISAKGHNRPGFAKVKIWGESSRQCFPPLKGKNSEEVAMSLSSCYEFSFQFDKPSLANSP